MNELLLKCMYVFSGSAGVKFCFVLLKCMYVCSGSAGVGTRLLWDNANSSGGAANKLELLNHYYMGELGSTVLHCTLKLQVRLYVCMYVCVNLLSSIL